MKATQKLQDIIKSGKPYARFDKAQLYRTVDNEHISFLTAKALVSLIDEPLTIQKFSGRLGRAILQPFKKETDVEQLENKNEVLCGLSVTRGLLNNNIVYKRFEAEVIGIDKDGNKEYKLITLPNGTKIKSMVWNLYVKDTELVDRLMFELPVNLSHRSLPTIFKPSIRRGFYCPQAGGLVTKVNRKYIKRFSKNKIPVVYHHINRLQQTPWNVNKAIYEAIIFNKGKDIFTFEKARKNLRKLREKGLITQEELQDVLTGKKRDLNCTLDLAEKMLDKDFYFYWFLDTRGRYYCASTWLSSQGTKLSKSLLMLKEGKKLGENGLKNLYIETATRAGFDKLTLEGRYNVVADNLKLILYIGNNPNETYDFWSQVDDPTGFLACCVEIANAAKCDDPSEYISHILVNYDATQSGLQIMSMLTKDEKTGKLTNLTDSNELGDVYLTVADAIWDELSDYWEALRNIRRKLVKRSVMTIFYSAGINCLAKTIYDDFKAELPGLTQDLSDELARAIWLGCKNELPGAFNVMKLFIKMGSELADRGKLVYVLGKSNKFPFIQSYLNPEFDRVSFKVNPNVKEMKLSYISKLGATINIKDVVKGSAPNIVHHFDSQLVSEVMECSHKDYTMIPTHDSFGALCGDADKLYKDVRIAFNYLFTEDLIQDLCDKYKVENTITYGKLNTEHQITNQFCFS